MINNETNMPKTPNLPDKQQGAALITMTIIMISVLTVVGITASKSSTLEARMATNMIEKQKALIAADSGVYYGWNEISSNFSLDDYVTNCNQAGSFDLRENADTSCASDENGTPTAKNGTVWSGITSAADWVWDSTIQHKTMDNSLAVDANFILEADRDNPMKLSSAPQYAIGIHEPILRKGTEGYYCLPVSVIGAGKGSVDTAQALVEIKDIPKSGCFRRIIK